MISLMSILYGLFLVEIEIGVLAFVVTLITVVIAVILKIIKNKNLQNKNSDL